MCSPNNPTANDLRRDDLLAVIKNNPTKIVVVDEAYVDFSDSETLAPLVDPHPNLIVLQTLSKAFGLAGVRHVVFFSRAKQSKQRPTTKILPLFKAWDGDCSCRYCQDHEQGSGSLQHQQDGEPDW